MKENDAWDKIYDGIDLLIDIAKGKKSVNDYHSPAFCPKCNAKSYVMDSRYTDHSIRRRRCCTKCGYKYTTYEVIDVELFGE